MTYTIRDEDALPHGSWTVFWWHFDPTLLGLALILDTEAGVLGIIIGPLKFGLHW